VSWDISGGTVIRLWNEQPRNSGSIISRGKRNLPRKRAVTDHENVNI
jgi:hypothetical protein